MYQETMKCYNKTSDALETASMTQCKQLGEKEEDHSYMEHREEVESVFRSVR